MNATEEKPPTAIGATADSPSIVVGYMCRTDFECELGCAADGNKVYPSVESLKEYTNCWPGCGIVEVQVRGVRVVEDGDGS